MTDIAPEPQSVAEAIATNPQPTWGAPEAAEPEVASEAPVDEAPAPEAPALEDLASEAPAPEAPAPEAPAPDADPFADLGGRETVEAALALHRASQTEDGLVQLFLEAGRNLGVGYDKIEALFTSPAQAAADEAPEGGYDYEADPDRPLTKKEFEEFQAKIAQERQQAEHARAVEVARTTLNETVTKLGIEPGSDTYDAVLRLGDKYLTRGDTNPESVAAAVQRGYDDYQALVEKSHQEYLAKKQATADAVPKSPAATGAPSEPAPAEPANTAEAIKIARRKLGFS